MANKLFELFGEKLKNKDGLVASDPQTLESLSESKEEQELIIESIEDLEQVTLKIDYSNFENFVCFNSALDYFNVTGEKILNDYPIDGTNDSLKKFEKDLDGYQKHVLSEWPSHTGHLRFNTSVSSSYVIVEDVGFDSESGVYRTGILSPGTGSITLEAWVKPSSAIAGTENIQIIAQKRNDADPTNLFDYSEDISQWQVDPATSSPTPNAAFPAGTSITSSFRISAPGGDATYLHDGFTSTADVYTFSMWIRSEFNFLPVAGASLVIKDGVTLISSSSLPTFDDTWTLYEFSALLPASSNMTAGIQFPSAGVQTALVTGGQVEKNSSFTTYQKKPLVVELSNGYTLYLTGSEIRFKVSSGSITSEVSSQIAFGEDVYVAGVFDRTSETGSISIITGSITEFPVVVQSSSIEIYSNIDISAAKFTMASGSLFGKTTEYFTGSLDDVKVWKKARSINEISSSFNVKQYAQENLVALYRFNSSGSAETADNRIVIDYSGKKLDGRIENYYSELRSSGSLLLKESLDPVLNLNAFDVQDFILESQASGSDYDRSNSNKLTDMLPPSFFNFTEEIESDILKNFLYIYARNFDDIKQHIDQFVNLLHVNYGKFDQTPDELLDVVAEFFGWEFTGNFLNTDAFQYMLGKNVLSNVDSNTEIDKKLYEIKNEFWKRTILNMPHMYKTKGTRESVRTLLRSYGVNDNFVRIKEYGHVPDVGIQTNRISSEKSVYALGFGADNISGSIGAVFSPSFSGSFTVEGTFRFPLTSSSDISATQLSGTMMSIDTLNYSGSVVLSYEKDSIGSHTGTLILSSSDGTNYVELQDVGIFNNEWYHVSVVNNKISSSLGIEVRHLDNDVIDNTFTSYVTDVSGGLVCENIIGMQIGPNTITDTTILATESGDGFGVSEFGTEGFGSLEIGLESVTSYAAGTIRSAEYWVQEIRYWDKVVNSSELDDHTMNFQSYGVCDINNELDDLRMHLRLRENVTASLGGILSIEDSATNSAATITTLGFAVSSNPYKKFLNKYNYIASLDFGWNEDKIRIFDTTELKQADIVNDSKIISLEFNMIDALNEDIVQTMKSLDSLNEAIGYPVNKYRVNYDELEILRHNYFKRLQGKLNFNVFADMLEFFDRSFIDMVRNLIPARAYFMGDEFVVESHMLERPKVTYERRKFQETEFSPEGIIEMWTRFRD